MLSARMLRARAEKKASRLGFFRPNPGPRRPSRDRDPIDLGDPLLWRQLLTVAAIYGRVRPDLAPDFDSEVNAACAYAVRRWRPGRGMTFRSYAVTVANARCSRVLNLSSRPRGYRNPGRREGSPTIRSVNADYLAATVADERLQPVGDALERSELAALALEAFGPHAAAYWRWLTGDAQLAELAAEEGVSPQAIQQRFKTALKRVRKQMVEEDTPADPSSPPHAWMI